MTREAQTLDTADGRSVLRMERRLAHPPERVWRAVTQPERLAEWFPTTASIELQPGGKIDFGFGGDGVVTDLDPPRLVAYTWGDDHLRWEIHPEAAGTLLVLVHTFADRAGAASFAAGWHTCVATLDLVLGGKAGTDPGVDHVALHERYVDEFDLDAAAVESTAGGVQVRIERQLVGPTDAALAALAGSPPWPGSTVAVSVEQEVGDARVRWELRPGTGHGARLVLTWTGPEAGKDTALADAPKHVADLAARLARP